MSIQLKKVNVQLMKGNIRQLAVDCVDEQGRVLHASTDLEPGVAANLVTLRLVAALEDTRVSQSFDTEELSKYWEADTSGRIKS